VGKSLHAVRERQVLQNYGDDSVVGKETRALLQKLGETDPSSSPIEKHHAIWIQQHLAGMCQPHNEEHLFVLVLRGLEAYCQSYEIEYASPVGEDGVIGEGVLQIAHGLNKLLNGQCRRLDPGTISGIIHKILTAHGFPEDD
jgi:hypothetical protein